VSGLPVRDSVARLLLIPALVESEAAEGWAPVAFSGDVVVVALLLEAGREKSGGWRCQCLIVRSGWGGWVLVNRTDSAGDRCESCAAAGRLGGAEELDRHCVSLFWSFWLDVWDV
jgi:hypothetical protein